MAHDILPEQLPLYPKLVEAGHLWADKVPVPALLEAGPFYHAAGRLPRLGALGRWPGVLWVINKTRQDADVKVSVDWKAIGMDPNKVAATNAESGVPVPLGGGGFSVSVVQRDFVPVLIAPR